jgi:predicted nucleic acid-binding Zn ribbon protein
VSRRRAPRPAAPAFRAALEKAAPKTRLAAVQAAWEEAVGARLAAAAQPVSERNGTLIIVCEDSVWAEELDLMQDQLRRALQQRLGEGAPRSLRFRVDADAK